MARAAERIERPRAPDLGDDLRWPQKRRYLQALREAHGRAARWDGPGDPFQRAPQMHGRHGDRQQVGLVHSLSNVGGQVDAGRNRYARQEANVLPMFVERRGVFGPGTPKSDVVLGILGQDHGNCGTPGPCPQHGKTNRCHL